jgi:hypothetical protein
VKDKAGMFLICLPHRSEVRFILGKKIVLAGGFAFLLIAGGCSFSKDVPCGCLPPKKQEQQDKALGLWEVVWSMKGKI